MNKSRAARSTIPLDDQSPQRSTSLFFIDPFLYVLSRRFRVYAIQNCFFFLLFKNFDFPAKKNQNQNPEGPGGDGVGKVVDQSSSLANGRGDRPPPPFNLGSRGEIDGHCVYLSTSRQTYPEGFFLFPWIYN